MDQFPIVSLYSRNQSSGTRTLDFWKG